VARCDITIGLGHLHSAAEFYHEGTKDTKVTKNKQQNKNLSTNIQFSVIVSFVNLRVLRPFVVKFSEELYACSDL